MRFKFLILFFLWLNTKMVAQPIGLRADKMTGTNNGGVTQQYLEGNVMFEQNGSTVYCDAADYSDASKNLIGRGNVRIFSNDGVNITGNTLTFNDFSKTARVDGNVQLRDKGMVLTAPFLVYNTISKIGYYGGGGKIVDGDQVLTSGTGSYNPSIKMLYFKSNVVLTHPDYIVKTDTLNYNTALSTAYFFSYTQITDRKSVIYCNNGYYNTKSGKAFFNEGAAIHTQGQVIKSDTLTFDRNSGEGLAFGKLWVNDSAEDVEIYGNTGYYNQKLNSTRIMGNAIVHRINEDTLLLKSDTFIYVKDSLKKEHFLHAIGKVNIWQPSFSGICSQLFYLLDDSSIKLFGSPILYNDKSQLNADSMRMQIKNKKLKTMWMMGNAINLLQEDSTKWSQIMGNIIINNFKDTVQELAYSNVYGNSKSIYFIKENDSAITTANKVSCQDMKILFANGKVSQIRMYKNPDGNLYPIKDFPLAEQKLPQFNWNPGAKPLLEQFAAPYPEPNIKIRKQLKLKKKP